VPYKAEAVPLVVQLVQADSVLRADSLRELPLELPDLRLRPLRPSGRGGRPLVLGHEGTVAAGSGNRNRRGRSRFAGRTGRVAARHGDHPLQWDRSVRRSRPGRRHQPVRRRVADGSSPKCGRPTSNLRRGHATSRVAELLMRRPDLEVG
jgi:hypothetical protein